MNREPPAGVVDAEFEDPSRARPCLGVIEVPIVAIDGTDAVGVALQVRGKGDGFVVLAIGDKNVQVRADQLEVALQSLAMLVRANVVQYGATLPQHDGFPIPFGDHQPAGPMPPWGRPRGPRPVP